MGAAAQPRSWASASAREPGLAEHRAVVELEHLVGADHQRVRPAATLFAFSSASISAMSRGSKPARRQAGLGRLLVERRRHGLERHARGLQHCRRAALCEASSSLIAARLLAAARCKA